MCPGLGLGLSLYRRTLPWGVLEVLESKESSGLVVLVTARATIQSGQVNLKEISPKRLVVWLSTSPST